MNEIAINNAALPVVIQGDFLVANSPFIHADRTADFNVIIYVTSGQINVSEDGTDYEINEGELLFLKSGVHHYGKTPINQGTSWYYMHFILPQEGEYPDYAEIGKSDNSSAASPYSLRLPKKLSGLSESALERSIGECVNCIHSADSFCRWNVNKKLFELLCECAFFRRGRTVSLADRIAEFLLEHTDENFSSKTLEHSFFLSYKHMAAVFRQEKKTTMQQYHNAARMQSACRLLRSTMLSVGEISAQLGFSDMLYFSRCFRAYAGLCPTEYRKRAMREL